MTSHKVKALRPHPCHYQWGELFLTELFEILGEEATGRALGEIYALHEARAHSPSEEDIYDVFLANTPANLEETFKDLYRRIHGGPFTGPVPPTATATPTAEEVAAAHLAEIIPWFENPPGLHSLPCAAETIMGIWLRDSEIGGKVARLSWVTDSVSHFELSSLDSLVAIAESDLETANLVLNLPWVGDDPTVQLPWVLESIAVIVGASPDLAKQVLRLPWIEDGMTDPEQNALRTVRRFAEQDLRLGRLVAGSDWFADGVDYDDLHRSEGFCA